MFQFFQPFAVITNTTGQTESVPALPLAGIVPFDGHAVHFQLIGVERLAAGDAITVVFFAGRHVGVIPSDVQAEKGGCVTVGFTHWIPH